MTKQKLIANKPSAFMVVAIVAVALSPLMMFTMKAQAAGLTFAYVRLNTLKGGASNVGGRVCAKPSAATTGSTKVSITFPTTTPTNYALNATPANWTTSTGSLEAGQTAWPSIGATATTVSGNTVTFASGVLSTTTNTYCFDFGNAITTLPPYTVTESSPGTVAITDNTPTTIASSNFSESLVSDDVVTVNAIVPPSFSFSLPGGNTDNFTTNLSITGVVATNGRTINLATNAAQGYVVWARGTNGTTTKGALKSTTASNYLISGSANAGTASRTLSVGSEDYGMGVTVGSHSGAGTTAADAAYDGASSKVGTLSAGTYWPIATSTGTVNADTLNFIERATISGATPAANDYSDIIQLVGAGRF